jgi:hypothetical protein
LCGARVQEYAQAAPLVGRSSGLFSAAVKWRQQLLSRLLLLQVINLGFFSFLRPFFYWSIVAALLPLLLLLSHYLYMARCTERKGFNEWENLQFRGFCEPFIYRSAAVVSRTFRIENFINFPRLTLSGVQVWLIDYLRHVTVGVTGCRKYLAR